MTPRFSPILAHVSVDVTQVLRGFYDEEAQCVTHDPRERLAVMFLRRQCQGRLALRCSTGEQRNEPPHSSNTTAAFALPVGIISTARCGGTRGGGERGDGTDGALAEHDSGGRAVVIVSAFLWFLFYSSFPLFSCLHFFSSTGDYDQPVPRTGRERLVRACGVARTGEVSLAFFLNLNLHGQTYLA